METNELYNLVIDQIKIANIHPLHKAIMEECCEKALNNKQGVTDKTTLLLSIQVAFLAACSILQGVLKAALELGDQVTLNYREQQFTILRNSSILNAVD
jgi:hypothetical protein